MCVCHWGGSGGGKAVRHRAPGTRAFHARPGVSRLLTFLRVKGLVHHLARPTAKHLVELSGGRGQGGGVGRPAQTWARQRQGKPAKLNRHPSRRAQGPSTSQPGQAGLPARDRPPTPPGNSPCHSAHSDPSPQSWDRPGSHQEAPEPSGSSRRSGAAPPHRLEPWLSLPHKQTELESAGASVLAPRPHRP